jgi:hypothetical protein
MGTGTDAFLRVRVIAGGQDAIFLVTKMCEMYSRYAEPKGWTTTLLSERVYSEGAESIALIGGDRAFNKLQHEAGIHRFQWVPPAGRQGRVLTFKIMVAIRPANRRVGPARWHRLIRKRPLLQFLPEPDRGPQARFVALPARYRDGRPTRPHHRRAVRSGTMSAKHCVRRIYASARVPAS